MRKDSITETPTVPKEQPIARSSLGTLIRISTKGKAVVRYQLSKEYPLYIQNYAKTSVQLNKEDKGKTVTLDFDQNNRQNPIITGVVNNKDEISGLFTHSVDNHFEFSLRNEKTIIKVKEKAVIAQKKSKIIPPKYVIDIIQIKSPVILISDGQKTEDGSIQLYN